MIPLGLTRKNRKRLTRCGHGMAVLNTDYPEIGMRVDCPGCGAQGHIPAEAVRDAKMRGQFNGALLHRYVPPRIARRRTNSCQQPTKGAK